MIPKEMEELKVTGADRVTTGLEKLDDSKQEKNCER